MLQIKASAMSSCAAMVPMPCTVELGDTELLQRRGALAAVEAGPLHQRGVVAGFAGVHVSPVSRPT